MTDLSQQKAGAAHVDPSRYNAVIDALDEGAGGSISEITSNDLSVTVTNPTGPTVDLAILGGGGNIDGGTASSVYTPDQHIDGGGA